MGTKKLCLTVLGASWAPANAGRTESGTRPLTLSDASCEGSSPVTYRHRALRNRDAAMLRIPGAAGTMPMSIAWKAGIKHCRASSRVASSRVPASSPKKEGPVSSAGTAPQHSPLANPDPPCLPHPYSDPPLK